MMDSDNEKFAWNQQEFFGSWKEGSNAGGYKDPVNPQFQMQLHDSNDADDVSTCVVKLMKIGYRHQDWSRSKQFDRNDRISIGRNNF